MTSYFKFSNISLMDINTVTFRLSLQFSVLLLNVSYNHVKYCIQATAKVTRMSHFATPNLGIVPPKELSVKQNFHFVPMKPFLIPNNNADSALISFICTRCIYYQMKDLINFPKINSNVQRKHILLCVLLLCISLQSFIFQYTGANYMKFSLVEQNTEYALNQATLYIILTVHKCLKWLEFYTCFVLKQEPTLQGRMQSERTGGAFKSDDKTKINVTISVKNLPTFLMILHTTVNYLQLPTPNPNFSDYCGDEFIIFPIQVDY